MNFILSKVNFLQFPLTEITFNKEYGYQSIKVAIKKQLEIPSLLLNFDLI